MAHFGDISDLSYTAQLVADTVDEYERVDGVVNFAGVLSDSISYKMSGEAWDRVIRVHLRGHFALLRNVGKHWRERAGDGQLDTQRSFLGVSSRSAMGSVGQANYAAAKAGILGLVRTTATELARYNVRVNALMPTAYTRMIENIPEEKRSAEQEEPPEKIAPVVAYLMSDEATDVTGCTIRAAGDAVGLVSNPEVERLAFKEGGWTLEAIADRFRDTVGSGRELDRSDPAF
jgi:NAD(P)-dependent dehydrogenase (short-subunit alcohol dehydrogenase family)